MLAADDFYNRLADVYDGMTQFSARLEANRALLGAVLDRHPAPRVLDMGCGTGVHAIALAQLGVDVTGVDVSAGMLEIAAAHAAETGTQVELLHGDFLTPVPRTPVDLLLCLGNSLPHLESRAALALVFTYWRTLVETGGSVVIQLLNYRRVLDLGERIVNIRRDGGTTIVRFYDFLDARLRFNILTINDAEAGVEHDLQSTMLTPFLQDDFEEAAHFAGFDKVECFGSLRFAQFTPESTDLVVTMG